jgi:hypothetical protein
MGANDLLNFSYSRAECRQIRFFQTRNDFHQNEMADVRGGALRKLRQVGEGRRFRFSGDTGFALIENEEGTPVFGEIAA